MRVPTIGIGAGPHCDGQILVFHDLVGYSTGYIPKFVKRYADLNSIVRSAVGRFRSEVLAGEYPDDEHTYH
jgi:3-methyl-2-oxobutanoate hydroxymethyltransferase